MPAREVYRLRHRIRRGEGVALISERVCGSCGELVEDQAQVCPWCGARFSGANRLTEPVRRNPGDPGFRRRNELAMIVVVAVLLVGLLGAAAVLIRHNSDSTRKVSTADSRPSSAKPGIAPSTTQKPATTSTTATTVPTTIATTTSSTLPGQGDPRTAPAGLLCRQLAAQGFDYPAAVAYWQAQGQPSRMDVDGNGRPCETVYPPAAVRAFWHT